MAGRPWRQRRPLLGLTPPPSGEPDDSGSAPRIRRQPSTSPSLPTAARGYDAPTYLIRRAPAAREPATTQIAGATGTPAAAPTPEAAPTTAIAASAAAITGGWATSVVATDLITGWWQSDRVFCLAVGFLALLFAASTVAGVILLLLRRTVGRWMIAFGAAVALLTFGSVFVAGAKLAWPVYVVPVLPMVSLLLALHPATRRWTLLP